MVSWGIAHPALFPAFLADPAPVQTACPVAAATPRGAAVAEALRAVDEAFRAGRVGGIGPCDPVERSTRAGGLICRLLLIGMAKVTSWGHPGGGRTRLAARSGRCRITRHRLSHISGFAEDQMRRRHVFRRTQGRAPGRVGLALDLDLHLVPAQERWREGIVVTGVFHRPDRRQAAPVNPSDQSLGGCGKIGIGPAPGKPQGRQPARGTANT